MVREKSMVTLPSTLERSSTQCQVMQELATPDQGEGLHKHNGTTSGLARWSSTVGGKVGRGLGHGDATQLQQEDLAELHLQVSVQTGEAVWDVHDDDEGGVLCPHQPQSPPCTVT
jgi:hypothetical protein